METVWNCGKADRVPFVPAVYEQKAFLIGDTPSRVSRDADLFYRAMMTECETYQADALVVGMDVYNLEAEALGAKVTFYEGDDTSIPGISGEGHALEFNADFSHLKVRLVRMLENKAIVWKALPIGKLVCSLHAAFGKGSVDITPVQFNPLAAVTGTEQRPVLWVACRDVVGSDR